MVKGLRRRSAAEVDRSAFAGFRFPTDVIVVAVRWYLRYGLSYRNVEELLAERGIEVDHVSIYRWVQRFTPLLAEAATLAHEAKQAKAAPKPIGSARARCPGTTAPIGRTDPSLAILRRSCRSRTARSSWSSDGTYEINGYKLPPGHPNPVDLA